MTLKYLSNEKVNHRTEVLLDACRGKRILHIGCCDHLPLIASKLASGDWLHSLITDCSDYTVGVDIDAAAVSGACQISGLKNIIAGDIMADALIPEIADKKFDIALFGEVVEHISNPVSFLKRFRENYGASIGQIIITVPNAFRAGNLKGAFNSSETINSDHRFFFTPYTISKVAYDAGFSPIEISMATFTRAGRLKSYLLNRAPLLAEDIIYIGVQRHNPSLPQGGRA
jgi:hypothetical protein